MVYCGKLPQMQIIIIIDNDQALIYHVLDAQKCFDAQMESLEAELSVSSIFLSVAKHFLVSKTQ